MVSKPVRTLKMKIADSSSSSWRASHPGVLQRPEALFIYFQQFTTIPPRKAVPQEDNARSSKKPTPPSASGEGGRVGPMSIKLIFSYRRGAWDGKGVLRTTLFCRSRRRAENGMRVKRFRQSSCQKLRAAVGKAIPSGAFLKRDGERAPFSHKRF